jgi:hypothetical protein
MSASAEKETRREIRRAVGERTASAMETLTRDSRAHGFEIARLRAMLGVPLTAHIKMPVLQRTELLEDNLLNVARAYQCHLEREMARNRSFWTRCRWLLTGK